MAICANTILTIQMTRDNKLPFDLGILTFTLVIAGGVIDQARSTVFQGTLFVSPVSGTCQPIARPDGNAFLLQFTWDRVDVTMSAFSYPRASQKVRGSWYSETHTGALPNEFTESVRSLAAPPDDGDTGTATGSQT